jgi:hypothetical protein
VTEPTKAAARRLLAIVLAADAATAGGCVAYEVVSAPVKLAGDAVVVTGETAGAAVKATGKVAVSAFNAAGRVGSNGIDAAARLTEAGMVTFVDVSTGTITRVPWRAGATLASSGATARVQLARRAIDIVRAGAVVYSSKRTVVADARVLSGDVVRIGG